MNNTTFVVIAMAVTAVGTLGIIAGGIPAADAAQRGAPGQTGCNPGLQVVPSCVPPGQNPFGTPGQCQNTLKGPPLNLDKEQAHDNCHTQVNP
jgi:hypothetical protein